MLNNPSERIGQKCLAEAVTTLVHGKKQADAAIAVTDVLFGVTAISNLSDEQKQMLLTNAPTYKVVLGAPLVDVLVETGLATSKREARTFIESDAIALGEEKCTDVATILTAERFTQGLLLLRRGKKQLCVLVQQ